MAIDEKRVAKFEKEYKDAIFEKINEVCSFSAQITNSMSEIDKNMQQPNRDFPNIGITIHNKILELSRRFNEAGISMFSQKLEDYDMVLSSFVGDALILDLINFVNDANEKVKTYTDTSNTITNRRNKQLQTVMVTSPIRRLFNKIKSFFVPAKPLDLSLTPAENRALNLAAQEYFDIDDKIYEYTLEANIVASLVKQIHARKYSADVVPDILKEDVIPVLEKLGLGELIPDLHKALNEEYRKGLPEEISALHIPDFNPTELQTKPWELSDVGKLNQQIVQSEIANKYAELQDTCLEEEPLVAEEETK